MMISHREAVRLEIVERLAKLADLARRGVVRREQLVLLARQDRLRVGLRQEREGLRDTTSSNGRLKSASNRPGRSTAGYSLSPSMPAKREPPAPRISSASRPKITRLV